ncbi:MAG: AIR synthase-related protein, partial [Christensenellales bacterium]
ATAMHDITEGGVFGAAWEMAEASGCGMVLYPEKVLMHPITKKICQKFGIDPYRLISSGSMLIACDDGEGMVKGLAAIGIPAAVIGKAVESGVSTADGTEIPAPEADELYKII